MSFKIKSDRRETEYKTIRFPLLLLEKIEFRNKNKRYYIFGLCNSSINSMSYTGLACRRFGNGAVTFK